MKSKMFILLLSVLLISLFSWNVFSEDTDPRIGLYYQLSRQDNQVSVDVFIQSASNVAGCQVWLTYNPAVLDYVDAVFEEGDYFSANAFYGQRQLESLSDTETRLRFAVASAPIENKNSGIIATLTFKVLNAEENLSLSLVDGDLNKGTGTLFSDATGSLLPPGVVELDDHSNILAGATPIDINLGQAISSSRSRNGKIDYESDVDYFKLEVTSPGELTVYSEKSSIEIVGFLFDSQGSAVAWDNFDGTVQNFRIVHRVAEATLSDPKIYYVEVAAFDNDTVGDYHLNVKFTARESPELIVESLKAVPLTALPDEEFELSTVLPGEKFKLVVIYKNVGDPTSAETAVKYYQSTNATLSETDLLIETGKNVSLDGKSRVRRTLEVTAPENSGVYYYGACVGPVPNERDPNNNCSDVVRVTVTGIGLEIPENLITDVAFTPNHTYFVLHPQFVSASSPMDAYLRQQCTVTLLLETLHLDGATDGETWDYYTLPLPPKIRRTVEEQTIDQLSGFVFQEMISTVPLLSRVSEDDENKKKERSLGDIMKLGNIILGFTETSEVEDPKATITYYPNSEAATSYQGDIYPILFIIQNKRLANVGFRVEQVYYQTGSWIPIELDFTEEEDSDTFNFVPFLGGALNFIKAVVVKGTETVFNTIGSIAEFINNQMFVPLMNAPDQYGHFTFAYAGEWNLEETFRKENPGFAAPHARPMSLSDYAPFQQLPPEIQAYLLQRFEGTANLKATNAEMWQMPEETSLLPNYPNPFNPETWIPYQLATPADVTLTIYDIQGRVVRDLDLGHQIAGMYHTRSRAAYWDGKNAHGESVASGVYFYTLTAGEFTATRKLLIRK